MAAGKLIWDQTGERFYETGIDHGVLYPYNTGTSSYDNGVAWNGLTSVTESPSGAESNAQYADNIKYLDLLSAEEFAATLECYTYPDEWELCDGSVSPVSGVSIRQQPRKSFGLSYRTKIGNDVDQDLGYKLHLVYGCKATPSERGYNTVNDSPEAITFSYSISTTPVNVTGYKATAIITIDSTKFTSTEARARLTNLENKLYGTDGTVTYSATADETPQDGKTYYTRSGSAEPYTYTVFTGDTFEQGVTYYEKSTSGGTQPYLPLPDEVISTLQANG